MDTCEMNLCENMKGHLFTGLSITYLLSKRDKNYCLLMEDKRFPIIAVPIAMALIMYLLYVMYLSNV